MNIPIYRAKMIDSSEYIEGYLIPSYEKKYSIVFETKHGFTSNVIDPSTLAIHFPDMIDKEGNKIFASLSEDGRGGDLLHFYTYSSREKGITRVCTYDNCRIIPQQDDDFIQDEQGDWFEGDGFKIVGTQE